MQQTRKEKEIKKHRYQSDLKQYLSVNLYLTHCLSLLIVC